MTASIEDYMKALFEIYERSDDKKAGIKSIELAERLGISKPSVSIMLKKLMEKGFIKTEPYSCIYLTTKGLDEGRRILHNHRVIEVFLVEVLGYSKDEVHEEAHRLEHAFSEETIRRLDEFLKHPELSPLGKKIPH